MIGNLTRLLGYASFLWVVGLCLTSAGCSTRPSLSREYFAVVEDIDDVSGEHYSPASERRPLYAYDLLITNPERGQSHVRLLVFGLREAGHLGEKGNHISFRIVGSFPVSGELWLEQLAEYRVLRQ